MMHQQRGVTMIEVLIAVLIFGVGVLGVAGLNLSGQQTNQKAYQSLLATWKAQELAETIRANSDNAAAYTKTIADIPSGASDCVAGSCSSAAIASYDLQTWHNSLPDVLPGTALSAVYAIGGGEYAIYVLWDNRDDNQSCDVEEDGLAPLPGITCVRMEFSL